MTSDITGMSLRTEPFAVSQEHPGAAIIIEYVNASEKGRIADLTFDIGWLHRAWPEGFSANEHNYKRYQRRLGSLIEVARQSTTRRK